MKNVPGLTSTESEVTEETMNNQNENAGEENRQMDPSTQERSLFIGGFTPQTKEDDILEYFNKFGEVESVRLKIDPRTNKSKGYGFVIFETPEPISKIVATDNHSINNKKITVGKAKLKEGKMFVGGLPQNMSEEDIKKHFSKFGNVLEVNIPFNKFKNERRSYCFVTFDSEKVVKYLTRRPKHNINGKEVDIGRAAQDENEKSKKMFKQQGMMNDGPPYMGPPQRMPHIPVWDFQAPAPYNMDNQGFGRNAPFNYNQGNGNFQGPPRRMPNQGPGKWGPPRNFNFQRRNTPY